MRERPERHQRDTAKHMELHDVRHRGYQLDVWLESNERSHERRQRDGRPQRRPTVDDGHAESRGHANQEDRVIRSLANRAGNANVGSAGARHRRAEETEEDDRAGEEQCQLEADSTNW